MRRRHAIPVITALIAALSLLAGTAAAQSDTEQLTVGGILCQDNACIDHSNLIPGFTITALDSATGDTLASCTTATADPHLCTMSLPAGADWTLAWDDGQVPEGYAWRGDLYPVADGPLGSATLIPFVPAEAPEPTVAPTSPPVVTEPGHVTAQTALCTDASCDTFAELLDGFTLSAVDPDTGEVFSTCATGNAQQGLDHQCILDVPGEGNWDITWDDSQVPDGYAYFGQPITTGEPAVMTIAFVPAAQPTVAPTIAPTATATQAPVTALPTTGSGPDAGSSLPWVAALLVLAGVSLTALAVVTRHRPVPVPIRRHR